MYCSVPDPSINKQNNEENLDFHCFATFYDFLSLQNDVNVPSKRNKQNNLGKKDYFLLAS
jgi:hypothetical protein